MLQLVVLVILVTKLLLLRGKYAAADAEALLRKHWSADKCRYQAHSGSDVLTPPGDLEGKHRAWVQRMRCGTLLKKRQRSGRSDWKRI